MNWLKKRWGWLGGKPRPGGIILMYHRIRDVAQDPWELCVSEAHFAEHLEVLKRISEVLPLPGAGLAAKGGEKRKKVFITFDDGYRDNYLTAFPHLKNAGVPATFFIPTRLCTQPTSLFWWEVLDQVFWLDGALPGELRLQCGEHHFFRRLAPEDRLRDGGLENAWSANSMDPPNERCRLYLELSAWIKERTPEEQQSVIAQLTGQTGAEGRGHAGMEKMSVEEILHLSREGFDLGAHSVHHPALAFQRPDTQRQEITRSKTQLEKLTGKRVRTFAYPHGSYDETTKALVRDAGFTLACTTGAGVLRADSDPYALPRIWAKDIDGDSFEQLINASFDH